MSAIKVRKKLNKFLKGILDFRDLVLIPTYYVLFFLKLKQSKTD